MPSTTELLDAAADTLDEEARETSAARRMLLLAWTRATIARWRAGLLTTEQAVEQLRVWVKAGPRTGRGAA